MILMCVEVKEHWIRIQVLKVGNTLESPGDSKNHRCLSPTPRESEVIVLVVGLGTGICKRSPGDAHV